MNARDLNQAFEYVDDAYLMEVDTPEKEIPTMKNKKRALRILIAAALISLLSISAYAADLLHIRSLESGSSKYYETYRDMDQALAQAGLETNIPEKCGDDFCFQGAEIQEINAKDENGNQVMTLQELVVFYENSLGETLILGAGLNLEELPKTDSIPTISKTVGGVEVNYYLDHYKFVPEGYRLSEAEEDWAKQPGNYVSYGADAVEEKDFAFLCWTKDEMYFFFYDRNAMNPDTLFAMAEEVIHY